VWRAGRTRDCEGTATVLTSGRTRRQTAGPHAASSTRTAPTAADAVPTRPGGVLERDGVRRPECTPRPSPTPYLGRLVARRKTPHRRRARLARSSTIRPPRSGSPDRNKGREHRRVRPGSASIPTRRWRTAHATLLSARPCRKDSPDRDRQR